MKKILSLFLSIVMLTSLAINCFAVDITEKDWFYKDMTWLNTKVTITDASGNYYPNSIATVGTVKAWFKPFLEIKTDMKDTATVTRTQLAQIISKSMELNGKYKLPGYSFFVDSSDESVKLLCVLKIFNGIGNNTFAGTRNVTRAELATTIRRVANLNGNLGLLSSYSIIEEKDKDVIQLENTDGSSNITEAGFVPTKVVDFYSVFKQMIYLGVYEATFKYTSKEDSLGYESSLNTAWNNIKTDFFEFFGNAALNYNFNETTNTLAITVSNNLKSNLGDDYKAISDYSKTIIEKVNSMNLKRVWSKAEAAYNIITSTFSSGTETSYSDFISNKRGSDIALTALYNKVLKDLGLTFVTGVNVLDNGINSYSTFAKIEGVGSYSSISYGINKETAFGLNEKGINALGINLIK